MFHAGSPGRDPQAQGASPVQPKILGSKEVQKVPFHLMVLCFFEEIYHIYAYIELVDL